MSLKTPATGACGTDAPVGVKRGSYDYPPDLEETAFSSCFDRSNCLQAVRYRCAYQNRFFAFAMTSALACANASASAIVKG